MTHQNTQKLYNTKLIFENMPKSFLRMASPQPDVYATLPL